MCFAILDELYHYYGVKDVVSSGATHHFLLPCALPPGLPLEVMKNVVSKFRKLLKTELDKIAALEGIAKEPSPQSDPASQYSTTGEQETIEGHMCTRMKGYGARKSERIKAEKN